MNDPNLVLKVKFYRTDSGKEPVRDWLRSLVPEQRQIIGEDMKAVQFGWPLGMPLVRKLAPDLWEVRSSLPQGIARVLFTVVGYQMVLLHGFIKKTQKLPQNELNTAQRRLYSVQQEDQDNE